MKAMLRLVRTRPQTKHGVQALLDYLESEIQQTSHPAIEALVRTLGGLAMKLL